jgi:hypothetical protein
MNTLKKDTKENSELRNNVHFLMFLNQVGYDNKTVKIIFSHEKLLKNIVETYYKVYNIKDAHNS